MADRVTTVTDIRECFIDPVLLEGPGHSAPPRFYNEDKYYVFLRSRQPPRKLLLHTRLGESGLVEKGPRTSGYSTKPEAKNRRRGETRADGGSLEAVRPVVSAPGLPGSLASPPSRPRKR